MTFLDTHLEGLPAPSPSAATAIAMLAALPFPNDPNHGAQGSARLPPKIHVHAYALRHKLMTQEAFNEHARLFLDQEEHWRGLGVPDGPQTYATDPRTEEPMLNDAGLPKKVTLYDAQHATVLPFLVIAACTKEHWLRGRALRQAAEYMDLVLADGACVAGDDSEPNQRAQGNPLVALAHWYAATGDARAIKGAAAIADRLKRHMGTTEAGEPHFTLNPPKADHKYRLVCAWYSLGRIGTGLAEWEHVTGLCDADLKRKLDEHAAYWISTGYPNDWLPGPVEYSNAMEPWCYESCLWVGEARYRANIVDLWKASSRMNPSSWKAGSLHDASIAIGLSRWLGWRA